MPYFRSKIKHGNSRALKNTDSVGVKKQRSLYHGTQCTTVKFWIPTFSIHRESYNMYCRYTRSSSTLWVL